MRLIKFTTDSGRVTFLNVEQIIYIGEDPMNEARTEIMTAQGTFFSKQNVKDVASLLGDPKVKEI